jgi:hypothetical protein
MGKHWYSYVRIYLRGGIVIYGNGGNNIVQEECLKYGKNTYGYGSDNCSMGVTVIVGRHSYSREAQLY